MTRDRRANLNDFGVLDVFSSLVWRQIEFCSPPPPLQNCFTTHNRVFKLDDRLLFVFYPCPTALSIIVIIAIITVVVFTVIGV